VVSLRVHPSARKDDGSVRCSSALLAAPSRQSTTLLGCGVRVPPRLEGGPWQVRIASSVLVNLGLVYPAFTM
jgi:hypothetical protein